MYHISGGQRQKWDPQLKETVLKAFRKNIETKTFPKKQDIVNFINKHSLKFKDNDFFRIRNLVVNSYTLF